LEHSTENTSEKYELKKSNQRKWCPTKENGVCFDSLRKRS